ncbi:hypothetical protein [Nannocystis pusilla]|uniref:hypothetical protein n=1 Tax=Nannocystis pusilla TaxID=889268 RepID=UPI003B8131C3
MGRLPRRRCRRSRRRHLGPRPRARPRARRPRARPVRPRGRGPGRRPRAHDRLLVADRTAVQLARDELDTFRRLLKLDVASTLGVTLALSDNDGD